MTTPPDLRRFGSFELDVGTAELRRDGRRVKLQPQPFRLLVLFTSRPGSLVTREEIRRQLWPDGTFVDFDQSVSFAVKQIREALGDSAADQVYLETIPRQGYRFIAPVDKAEKGPARATTAHLQKAMWANIAELRVAQVRQRRLTYAAIGLGLLVLAVLGYVILFV
jgi:DNA-binding winged helix-turn-helix (wHTH) protein